MWRCLHLPSLAPTLQTHADVALSRFSTTRVFESSRQSKLKWHTQQVEAAVQRRGAMAAAQVGLGFRVDCGGAGGIVILEGVEAVDKD